MCGLLYCLGGGTGGRGIKSYKTRKVFLQKLGSDSIVQSTEVSFCAIGMILCALSSGHGPICLGFQRVRRGGLFSFFGAVFGGGWSKVTKLEK